MTLYTNKESNIRKTWLLFTIFLIVVIGLGWIFSRIYGNPGILFFAVGFSILMSFLSYWYSDKIVIGLSKAKPVTRENARELYNVVENLCITAGLPTPKIYLIEDSSPNAFATGRNPFWVCLTARNWKEFWLTNFPISETEICFCPLWLWF